MDNRQYEIEAVGLCIAKHKRVKMDVKDELFMCAWAENGTPLKHNKINELEEEIRPQIFSLYFIIIFIDCSFLKSPSSS